MQGGVWRSLESMLGLACGWSIGVTWLSASSLMRVEIGGWSLRLPQV